MCVRFESGLIGLAVVALGWSSYCLGQTSQSPPVRGPEPPAIALAGEQPTAALSGSVSGTVVDQSGALVAGAEVTLTRENHSRSDHSSDEPSPSQEVLTGGDGQFFFTNVTPGPFHLTITSAGLAAPTHTGILHSGE